MSKIDRQAAIETVEPHLTTAPWLGEHPIVAALRSLPEAADAPPAERSDEEREIEKLREEVGIALRYAAYCRSCALSGEVDPDDYETFKDSQ